MDRDFLLKTKKARRLYEGYAKDLPIIDFHNHLSIRDIADNRMYENLTELWLESDPYKHRLMRISGVPEHYISGDAEPFEKMEKFCSVFPYLAGTPVYDWSRMELYAIFGIKELPCKESARQIYDSAGEMLKNPEFSNNAILGRFNIEYQSPVATLYEDISAFKKAGISPSLRGDNLLSLGEPTDLKKHLDNFDSAGCRFADHALDAGFFEFGNADRLVQLAFEYAKRGWTLLLHLGALRQTSSRLARIAGPAGGYAAVGSGFPLEKLCTLLNRMEEAGALPKTVLFPLNMNDQASLAALEGSFSADGVAGKIQLGPAWWWCDHTFGIRNTLDCIASFGVVSQFIGMTTDSRSILSFIRHDYFRRLVCSWVAEQDWGLSIPQMGAIIQNICYYNAKRRVEDVQG